MPQNGLFLCPHAELLLDNPLTAEFCLQRDHQELPLAQIHWAAIPKSTVSAVCAAGGAAPFTSKLRQFGAWCKTRRTVTSSTSLHLHALPQHHLLLFYVRSLYYFFLLCCFLLLCLLKVLRTIYLLKKKCWDGDKEKVCPEMPWFFSVALEDGASVPGRT